MSAALGASFATVPCMESTNSGLEIVEVQRTRAAGRQEVETQEPLLLLYLVYLFSGKDYHAFKNKHVCEYLYRLISVHCFLLCTSIQR